MGLEAGTYVNDLVTTNPAGADGKAQGDDHLRLIKSVLKATFPNATTSFRFPTAVALEQSADSPHTQLATEKNATYLVDATAGAFTIDLLAAAVAGAGFIFQIFRTDTSTNTITLDPNSSETINGETTLTIIDGAIVFCTGSAWLAFPIGPDLNTLVTETTVDPSADFIPFFDNSAGRWRKGLVNKFTVPIGAVIDFAGTSAPSGWLLSYGQAISRTTYATLFAAIGTTYGTGDGSTTFNVPDLRGRTRVGKDDMGGAAASRITAASKAAIDGLILGATGGSEEHALSIAEMPEHNHPVSPSNARVGTSTYNWNGGGNPVSPNNATVLSIGNTGGSEAHTNMQPTIILNSMIFAGV